MSSRDARLAALLRTGQWALDHAAFELGGGRYSDQERRELADALEQLGQALRESCEQVPPLVEGDVESAQ